MPESSLGNRPTGAIEPSPCRDRFDELIAEKFRLTKKLASGGMGDVYRAIDIDLRREVVVKFVRPDLTAQPGRAEQLRDEAMRAASMTDPHVVTVFQFGRHGPEVFIVFEFVAGDDASALLKKRRQPLSVEEAVGVIRQVGPALHRAHEKGLIHRDIKPSNLLIGPNSFAKLADFGLAASDPGELICRAGTPGYIAPELGVVGGQATPLSDQYSFAMTLANLVTDLPPSAFQPTHVSAPARWLFRIVGRKRLGQAHRIPALIRPIVERGLSSNPADRYGSVLEFCGALEAAVPPPLSPQDAFTSVPAPARSWSPGLVGFLLVCGIFLGVYFSGVLTTDPNPGRDVARNAPLPPATSTKTQTDSNAGQAQPSTEPVKQLVLPPPPMLSDQRQPARIEPEQSPSVAALDRRSLVSISAPNPVTTATIEALFESARGKLNTATKTELAACMREIEQTELAAMTKAIDQNQVVPDSLRAPLAALHRYRGRLHRLLISRDVPKDNAHLEAAKLDEERERELSSAPKS